MEPEDEHPSEYIIGQKVEPLRPSAHLQLASLSVVGLLLLAAIYTIYFTKPFLMPLVLALLVTFVLRPVHRWFVRLGLPHVLAAAMVMIVVVGLTLGTMYTISGPVLTWAAKLPAELRQVQHKLQILREPVQKVTEVAEQVDELAAMDTTPTGPPVVEMRQQKISESLMKYLGATLGYTAVTLVLVFFMLAFGDAFYRQLGRHDETVAVFHQISDSVSQYLFTITVINIGLGVCIGAAMFLIGMPNPILWGVMATLLNFIPFLGAFLGIGTMTVVSMLTFEEVWRIVLVPLTFFIITAIEGNFVTPTILGRRFTVNPIVVFVWVVLWGWIWAAPGAVIAVPLLMALKIVFDRVGRLRWISELISYQNALAPPKTPPAASHEESIIHVAHR